MIRTRVIQKGQMIVEEWRADTLDVLEDAFTQEKYTFHSMNHAIDYRSRDNRTRWEATYTRAPKEQE